MADRRWKNATWNIADKDGTVFDWTAANCAVLMDIRDELQRLNRLLGCPNFTAIPAILRIISRNTQKAKRKAKRRKSR